MNLIGLQIFSQNIFSKFTYIRFISRTLGAFNSKTNGGYLLAGADSCLVVLIVIYYLFPYFLISRKQIFPFL